METNNKDEVVEFFISFLKTKNNEIESMKKFGYFSGGIIERYRVIHIIGLNSYSERTREEITFQEQIERLDKILSEFGIIWENK